MAIIQFNRIYFYTEMCKEIKYLHTQSTDTYNITQYTDLPLCHDKYTHTHFF